MSIDARLATAAEVAEHIRNGADTGIVGPGSSGYWESDLTLASAKLSLLGC